MEKIYKTYVRKIYCGSYNFIDIEEVDSRDPAKIKNDGLMAGFSFYDKEFVFDGDKLIKQKVLNRSKFIYFGERLSINDLKARCINNSKYGSLDSLIKKMESNGNENACYTNGGNIFIMHNGEMTYDEVVTKQKKLSKHR